MKKVINLRNILFFGIIINLVVILYNQQSVLDRNMNTYNKLKEQIVEENEYYEKLQNEQSIVGTDEYIERKAREELGYVKKNEIVFINER